VISKEKLEFELEGLHLQRKDAEVQINAVDGAIQLIMQLIKFCDEPEAKEEDK